jgi:signal transduction histidine kinase
VGNLIRFPSASKEGSAVADLLADPPRHTHAVQFYEEPDSLYEAVSKFIGAGLEAGDRVVIIATVPHRDAFVARLDRGAVARGLASGQLTFLDARDTLAKFMVGEAVDPDLFRNVLSRIVAHARANAPDARIRAFGEMVDLLWRDGNSNAALHLEELWETACTERAFTLLCAYSMGHFYREADGQRFKAVCESHSHVIPTEGFTRLDEPYARLREISVLQQRARSLETELLHRKGLETALREALRDRSRVEAELRESVRREREARTKAEANDSFKEQFLAVLGHDLRNPLNTILTTARLMLMRGEVSGDSQKRLDRVVSSGVRMQRMIEQILDVTHERLSPGISVSCDAPRDVVPIVTRVVEELQSGHPTKSIALTAERACVAPVDEARIEQVLRTIVGNAATHGDGNVSVSVTSLEDVVTIEVWNAGPPIDADLETSLFEPFKRTRKTNGRSEGLGLGLFIARRILEAHEGKLELQSSLGRGTCFRVILPREL